MILRIKINDESMVLNTTSPKEVSAKAVDFWIEDHVLGLLRIVIRKERIKEQMKIVAEDGGGNETV